MTLVDQLDIPHCRFIDFFLLVTSARRRFRVSGLSMFPCLLDGEEVIAKLKAYSLQVNDIVVLYHPLRPNLIMIKRIKQILIDEEKGNQQYFVQGDNISASTDSRHFGWVNEDLIIGKIICRFP